MSLTVFSLLNSYCLRNRIHSYGKYPPVIAIKCKFLMGFKSTQELQISQFYDQMLPETMKVVSKKVFAKKFLLVAQNISRFKSEITRKK